MPVEQWLRQLCVFLFVAAFCAAASGAQTQPPPNLMPMPARWQMGPGSLPIDSSFSVSLTGYEEPRLDRAVQRFVKRLSQQT